MSGTKEGGRKAAMRNLAKDPNFYKRIGAIGGKATGLPKGFGVDRRSFLQKLLRRPKHASIAGKTGGQTSRRGKANA